MMLALAALAVLLFLSATYSGSETGVYSISRLRLDAEASAGGRGARLLRRLVRDDAAILITLLVGNNLMLELATLLTHARAQTWGLPESSVELAVTLGLTPLVFLFGELLPKELFRRHPRTFLGLASPLLVISRLVYLPLVWPLRGLAWLLERVLGVGGDELTRVLAREEIGAILQEGTREGVLEPRAEQLARNVLVLRERKVADVALAWKEVDFLDLEAGAEAALADLAEAEFSRLPVVDRVDGQRRVTGYVHQLDLWRKREGLLERQRTLPSLEPELALDEALRRLRVSGQRLALVGTPEDPRGLVTLMDLLAAISGQVGGFRDLAATRAPG